MGAKPETYVIDGHKVVFTKVERLDRHERSRWSVQIDGVERGIVVFPAGFGKPPEAWPLTGQPKFIRDHVGKVWHGSPSERRERLAKCFVDFMARGGSLPSRAEIAEAMERARIEAETADREHRRRRAELIAGGVALIATLRAISSRLRGILTDPEALALEEAAARLVGAYPPEVAELSAADRSNHG